jgi:hypothetical protein
MNFTPTYSQLHDKIYRHPERLGLYGAGAIEFDYERSWSSLIPVWHKIRDLDFKSGWKGDWTRQLHAIGVALRDKDIQEVHEEIVKAIIYYNENK